MFCPFFLKLLKIDFEMFDAIFKFNPRNIISNKYILPIFILDYYIELKKNFIHIYYEGG